MKETNLNENVRKGSSQKENGRRIVKDVVRKDAKTLRKSSQSRDALCYDFGLTSWTWEEKGAWKMIKRDRN